MIASTQTDPPPLELREVLHTIRAGRRFVVWRGVLERLVDALTQHSVLVDSTRALERA